jgi:queuine/archaeosine tRNA-ribosyltransferase
LPLYSFYSEARAPHVWNKRTNRKCFLDSGAFGALSLGRQINIDEYIEYIKDNDNLFELYTTLDVIGDYERTNLNTDYMEKRGLRPLPVYHVGSPQAELERLIDRYDYIALGGLVALSSKRSNLISWLDYCYAIIKDRIKIHGFGVTAYRLLERYPFYSVDSSSWMRAVQNGNFINHKGKSHDKTEATMTTYELRQLWEKDAQGNKSKEGKRLRVKLRADSMAEFDKRAREITNIWTKRGVTWND